MNHEFDAPGSLESLERLRGRWACYVSLGVAIIALGMGAIAYSFLATITTVTLLGFLLLVGGLTQVVAAFLARTWRGFFISALVGVLHILVGAVMVEHPLRAAVVLTLVLAIAFLVGGTARLLYAATHTFPGRGWVLVNGVITLILGVSIWQEWPEASLWVIGLFAGIDLVFSGWSWLAFGLAVKADVFSAPRTPQAAPAAGA